MVTNVVKTYQSESWNDPTAHTYDIEFPILVNTKPINKGDEMVVFWHCREVPAKSKQPKSTTWADQVVKKKAMPM